MTAIDVRGKAITLHATSRISARFPMSIHAVGVQAACLEIKDMSLILPQQVNHLCTLFSKVSPRIMRPFSSRTTQSILIHRTISSEAGADFFRYSRLGSKFGHHGHDSRVVSGHRFVSSLQTNVEAGPQRIVGSQHGDLSALPTRMLLRSLLIATISSKRFLLIPSLKILSFLSKPGRGCLLNVDKNPLIHAFLKKTFYDQFCAGETRVETKATCQQIRDLGFRGVLLTFAKETVFDHRTRTEHSVGEAALEARENSLPLDTKVALNADIEAWRRGTLDTIDLLGETDYLAVKSVRLRVLQGYTADFHI